MGHFMDTNIDDALARLATATPYSGLDGLESRVMTAITLQPAGAGGAGVTVAAIGLALTLGVLSNVVPTSGARAAPALSPFGAPSPLAPSTLLGGTR